LTVEVPLLPRPASPSLREKFNQLFDHLSAAPGVLILVDPDDLGGHRYAGIIGDNEQGSVRRSFNDYRFAYARETADLRQRMENRWSRSVPELPHETMNDGVVMRWVGDIALPVIDEDGNYLRNLAELRQMSHHTDVAFAGRLLPELKLEPRSGYIVADSAAAQKYRAEFHEYLQHVDLQLVTAARLLRDNTDIAAVLQVHSPAEAWHYDKEGSAELVSLVKTVDERLQAGESKMDLQNEFANARRYLEDHVSYDRSSLGDGFDTLS
jgi:hypothetical protein